MDELQDKVSTFKFTKYVFWHSAMSLPLKGSISTSLCKLIELELSLQIKACHQSTPKEIHLKRFPASLATFIQMKGNNRY